MPTAGISGTTALVTGAGQGIGAAVARALAAEGATVAAVDRAPDGVRRLAARSEGRVTDHVADVADADRLEAVVDDVERHLGPIGILVNVAGVLHPGEVLGYADADWERTFAVNSQGVFNACRAVARRMAPRRRGSIVTVSSNAAGVPRAGMAAYAASKAAATMFTKCLGLELARHGIRCNVVAPGSTDTPMQRAVWGDTVDPDPGADRGGGGYSADNGGGTSAGNGRAATDRVIAGDLASFRTGIPLGRLAQPDDIADAVLFLASDRARHITMHDLYVDGGATLRA